MIFFWKIRYFDRKEKKFKDRCLYLDPRTTSAKDLACIELLSETRKHTWDQKILKFRHLFREISKQEEKELWQRNSDGFENIFLVDYFEDEDGNKITAQEALRIKHNNPDLVVVPPGLPAHFIEYLNAPESEFDFNKVNFSDKEFEALQVFTRDYYELKESRFHKEFSNLSLHFSEGIYEIYSSFTDEDVRAFVAVFRRLYKKDDRDPGNYENICKIYQDKIEHPSAKYLEKECLLFQELKKSTLFETKQHTNVLAPINELLTQELSNELTVEQFLDTIIYTRYLHHPKQSRKKIYLAILNSITREKKDDILNWIFLSCMHALSLHILNIGSIIEYTEKRYQDNNCIKNFCPKMNSVGMGSKEDYESKKARIFAEKVTKLSEELWKQDGHPKCGPSEYKKQATLIINDLIESDG